MDTIEVSGAIQLEAVKLVLKERARQQELWGEQKHMDFVWATILGEEYGEFCKAVNDSANVCEEAIHVAAVALQIVEGYCKNGYKALEVKDEKKKKRGNRIY